MPTTDATPSTRSGADGDGDSGSQGENVLVLASADGNEGDAYCAERFFPQEGTVEPDALLVSIREPADRRFDAVVRHGDGGPSNVAIVCCDETRGAAATSGAGHGPGMTPGPWITSVGSPGDLTGLGVRIRQALSNWEFDPGPVELCFHDLQTLLGHVDDRAAFRFCHAVTRHVLSVGAGSHFHLDPEAVSEQTFNTLRPLFDRVEDRR